MGKVSAVRAKIEEGRGVKVPELSLASGWPRTTLYTLIRRGEIESVRLGHGIIIPAHEARRVMGRAASAVPQEAA